MRSTHHTTEDNLTTTHFDTSAIRLVTNLTSNGQLIKIDQIIPVDVKVTGFPLNLL